MITTRLYLWYYPIYSEMRFLNSNFKRPKSAMNCKLRILKVPAWKTAGNPTDLFGRKDHQSGLELLNDTILEETVSWWNEIPHSLSARWHPSSQEAAWSRKCLPEDHQLCGEATVSSPRRCLYLVHILYHQKSSVSYKVNHERQN